MTRSRKFKGKRLYEGGERTPIRILGAVIAVILVPVLFFVLLEVGLRLGGYGVNTNLILEAKDGATRTCYLNGDVANRYFSPALRSIQPSVGFRTFTKEKQPGTVRVFVLGESTVAGFPFHVNGSFAGFLEDDLRASYPSRSIEVINCGMSAISSYTVLDFAKQLVHYQPDAFIVYLGHNEFYGALGAGSTTAASVTRGITMFRMSLAKHRTYQLLSNAIFKLRSSVAKKDAPQGRSLMAVMIREKTIRLDDPIHKMAEETFRANLEAIIEVAESNNIPIIVSTLASNLRDLPPFGSAHRDGIEAKQSASIDAAIQLGDAGMLRAAVVVDSTYAAAHYALARALEADSTVAGRARREYIAARDHDVIHFRACTRFNHIIRDVANAHRTTLVDMDAIFAAVSPGRTPGLNLFLEHLHPNLHGAILMASALREAMRVARIIPPSTAAERSYEQAIHDAALTPFDLELAHQRINSMTGQWPFERAYGDLATEFPEAEPNVARYARAALEKKLGLDAAHERLGREYLEANNLERAVEEYRALAKIYPVSPVGHMNAAEILFRLGRPIEAIPYYKAGLELDPTAIEPRLHLAEAYHAVGADRDAARECQQILTIAPAHVGARTLLQELAPGL